MKKSYVYIIWALLYCLCAGLGFIPSPEGFGKSLLIACGFVFFLPPYYLGWVAYKQDDRKTMKELRAISLVAIGLFFVFFVLNILVSVASGKVNPLVEELLYLLVVPMGCGVSTTITLLMWACLLMISLRRPPEK